jgi:predicted nuclease of predicted toxin-antitoxin system
MSLRLFADQCVPTEIVQILRDAGHNLTMVREVMPVGASDQAVIARAQELQAILISLNGDFSDIVSYPPRNYRGIISIQLHNHPEVIPPVMRLLLAHFRKSSRSDALCWQAVVG